MTCAAVMHTDPIEARPTADMSLPQIAGYGSEVLNTANRKPSIMYIMMYKWNIYPQFGMFEHGVHSFWIVVIHYTSFAWWVHCSNGLDP